MGNKICDNKSVGQIIYKGPEILLIERRNYPRSYALPAGHLDGDDFETAALRETKEETGIVITKNKLVWEGKINNYCKRQNGSYHQWAVFQAEEWSAEAVAGSDAKKVFWAPIDSLKKMALRTAYFLEKYKLNYEQVGELTGKIFGN